MISIVIPVYKNYDLLHRCLQSIDSQVNKDDEVILIDDTPVANQCEINTSIPNVVIYKNFKNRGVTYSRNKGYMLAKNRYLVFLDSDDELLPDALSYIRCCLSSNSCNLYTFSCVNAKGDVLNRNADDYLYSNGISSLISNYNKGERLVAVRKSLKAKPFISSLRGHEFAGLLRFLYKLNDNLPAFDSITPVRKYNRDNPHSISAGVELKKRVRLIEKGHFISSSYLFKNKRYYYSLLFFLKGLSKKVFP